MHNILEIWLRLCQRRTSTYATLPRPRHTRYRSTLRLHAPTTSSVLMSAEPHTIWSCLISRAQTFLCETRQIALFVITNLRSDTMPHRFTLESSPSAKWSSRSSLSSNSSSVDGTERPEVARSKSSILQMSDPEGRRGSLTFSASTSSLKRAGSSRNLPGSSESPPRRPPRRKPGEQFDD